jgi:hypothetical protein
MRRDEEPAATDAGFGQRRIMPNWRKCVLPAFLPGERVLAAP